MARYFYIQLTGGTSSGPYSIYYNSVTVGNLATLFPSGLPASGITLSDLTLGMGVQVEIPDDATSIIIYNEKCDISQVIDIGEGVTGTCFCLTIIPISGQDGESITQILFCPTGFEQNGKPVYEGTISGDTGTTYELSWQGNFWQVNGIPIIDGPIRSFNSSNVPLTGWEAYGECNDSYVIRGDEGECPDVTTINYINCKSTNPTCLNDANGTITSYAIGGTGGWLYSLDGINFTNSLGVFTGLYAGSYTVYAKDSSGTIITCSILLTAPYSTNYPLIINITNPDRLIGTSLNYKTYKLDFEIDTSGLINGVSVSFNFDLDYILSYVGPGSAFFDTTNHQILVNGLPVSMSQTSAVPITQNGQSLCDATYNSYMGHNQYQTPNIVVTSNDTVTGYIVYSIDTESAGQFITPCITTATVNVVATLKNAKINSVCDKVSVISLEYDRIQTFSGGPAYSVTTTQGPISTTTLPPCSEWYWTTTLSASTLTYTDCNSITQTVSAPSGSNGIICVKNGTTPIFNPTLGTTLTNTYNICTIPVPTTTTTTLSNIYLGEWTWDNRLYDTNDLTILNSYINGTQVGNTNIVGNSFPIPPSGVGICNPPLNTSGLGIAFVPTPSISFDFSWGPNNGHNIYLLSIDVNGVGIGSYTINYGVLSYTIPSAFTITRNDDVYITIEPA